MSIRETIQNICVKIPGVPEDIEITVPEKTEFGHYATNIALRLAKEQKKTPGTVADELISEIFKIAPKGFFSKIEKAGPGFINFWVAPAVTQKELQDWYKNKKQVGKIKLGKKQKVIVEYSSPNIAKPMHVGHLRNTVTGAALANIFDAADFKVIRWNYLGDWGTQFGKIIAAYKFWGDKKKVKKNPIEELSQLYIKFHDELKSDPELEKRGQEEFKKLEEGNRENRALWEWFKKESIEELKRIYKLLGAEFDVWIGEAFFEKEMKPLVEELLKSGIAVRSEGAVVVSLDGFKLPPALVQKSDGASLYLTRDIANLRYRLKTYKPIKILYVVGNEQALSFEQLFAVAKILKFSGAELVHVKYGLVLADTGKKLSTREGRTEPLTGIVHKAHEKALAVVEAKNPDLSQHEKKAVARIVGLGAIKYALLKDNLHSDIVFNWDKMLDFTGDSGPYLQYTYARQKSILRKAGKIGKTDMSALVAGSELEIVRKIDQFSDELERSVTQSSVNNITKYLFELAGLVNGFYESTPILKDENAARRNARLVLVETSAKVLKGGLELLGIETLEKI